MRAVRRPASKATAPARPRSSPHVRTRSTSRCGRLCCAMARTASSSAATLALLSAPSTVRPSVLMTPSRSTGLTPRPGSTVSVWAHNMIGGRSGRAPGNRTCRLPAPSRPVRSFPNGRPSASSSVGEPLDDGALLVRHRVDLHERQERLHHPVGVDGNHASPPVVGLRGAVKRRRAEIGTRTIARTLMPVAASPPPLAPASPASPSRGPSPSR